MSWIAAFPTLHQKRTDCYCQSATEKCEINTSWQRNTKELKQLLVFFLCYTKVLPFLYTKQEGFC